MKRIILSAVAIATLGISANAVNISDKLSDSGNLVFDDTVTNTLTITQTGSRGAINWNSFNVGAGETVNFNNSGGITLNRVVGTESSVINGALNSDGSIFLVNKNGIIMGSTSSVNAQKFLASTYDMDETQFLNDFQDVITSNSDGGAVSFEAGATVNVDELMVFAHEIQNNGTLTSAGNFQMGGSSESGIEYNLAFNNVLYLRGNDSANYPSLTNNGAISGDQIQVAGNLVNNGTISGNSDSSNFKQYGSSYEALVNNGTISNINTLTTNGILNNEDAEISNIGEISGWGLNLNNFGTLKNIDYINGWAIYLNSVSTTEDVKKIYGELALSLGGTISNENKADYSSAGEILIETVVNNASLYAPTMTIRDSSAAYLQSSLDTANNQVSTLTNQLNNANFQLATKTAEIETLNTQISSLNSQIEGLASNLDSYIAEVDTLNGQISSLSTDKSTLETSLATKTAEIETLNTQIVSLTDERNGLASMKIELESERAVLIVAKSDLEDALSKLQAETIANDKTAEIETLNTQISSLNNQIAEKDLEIETLGADLEAKTVSEKQIETVVNSGVVVNNKLLIDTLSSYSGIKTQNIQTISPDLISPIDVSVMVLPDNL